MLGVLIPAFNEARSIARVVRASSKISPHVLVVDDGSTDNTAEEALSSGAQLVRHEKNGGLGCAVISGINRAAELGWTSILTCDGDGAHDFADAGQLIAADERSGHALILGSRAGRRGDFRSLPDTKKAANRMACRVLNRLAGANIPDWLTGYRLLRVKDFAQEIDSRGFAVSVELVLSALDRGLRIGSVPIRPHYSADELWYLKSRELRDFLAFCANRWHEVAFEQAMALAAQLKRFDILVSAERFALHPLRERSGYFIQAYRRRSGIIPNPGVALVTLS